MAAAEATLNGSGNGRNGIITSYELAGIVLLARKVLGSLVGEFIFAERNRRKRRGGERKWSRVVCLRRIRTGRPNSG